MMLESLSHGDALIQNCRIINNLGMGISTDRVSLEIYDSLIDGN